jgi:uncharacterized protein (TIGR02099 family)
VGALLGWLGLTVLVLATIYLSAGRLLLPRVAGESARIEMELSQLLKVPVRIEGLRGRWQDFTPWLEVAALTLQTPEGAEHRIENLSFAIDVWPSLHQRRLEIASLAIGSVDLVVEQTPDGQWTLAGLPPGQGSHTEQIIDFLLSTPHMSLAESRLTVRPREGQPLTLHSVFAEIENSGRQHRAELQFLLDEQPEPSRLSVELSGMRDTGMSGRGWATLPDLDLKKLLLPWLSTWQLDAARLSSELWFDFDAMGAVSFTGRVRDAELAAQETERKLRIPLSAGNVDVLGTREATGQWDLQLAKLGFDWDQKHWDVPALRLSRPDAEAPTILMEAASVELGMLSALTLDAAPLPGPGAEALRTLAPEGVLRNLHVETRSDGSYPGFFQLRANLENGAVQAWANAPSGSNLFAYVEASALSGVAEVNSDDVTLQLPRLFADAWHYNHVNGRVAWQVADGEVRVQSNLLDVHSDDLDGRVGFAVLDRNVEDGSREHSFKLMVGVDRMAVVPGKIYLPMFPNQPRLSGTMDWLRTALQGGELDHSGFMLRIQRRNREDVSTSVQSWYQAHEGKLQFLSDWAPVDHTTAGVTVRDDAVDVVGRSASIDGVPLGTVVARSRPGAEGGSWLAIDGTADTDTANGLRFLLNSPLHQVIGPAFDTWQPTGQLNIALNLGIPLGDNPRERIIDVDVRSKDSTLTIPEFSLDFIDVNGLVQYSEQQGLSAKGLQAQLFDQPVSADISSTRKPEGGQLTQVSGGGHASVDVLRNWAGMPEFVRRLLAYAEGELDYDLALEFPGAAAGGPRLKLDSNLVGVSTTLPAPFAKTAEERHDLAIDYLFGGAPDSSDSNRIDLLNLRFDDTVSGELVLDSRGLNRGQVYVGELNRDFTMRQADDNAAGLLVSGTVPTFDFDAWNAVAQTLTQEGGQGRTFKESLRLVDVNVGDLNVFGQAFDNINVQVQPAADGWQIQGRNALLGGQLLLTDTGPWQVNLEYLRFPPRPERTPEEARAAEDEDLLEAVDPTKLPAFDFNTAEISIGPSNLGKLAFIFRPYADGARIREFRLESPQSQIIGSMEGTGASIDWNYSAGMHQSHFIGLVTATNLAEVLPAWGHDAFLDSKSARFEGALSWPASPLGFQLKRSSGDIALNIANGRFVEISSGSSRLLGAFNFDAVVRRLQLDFSDLFGRGFAYDSITAKLQFTNGVIATHNTLMIDGPSSRLRIDGEISLPDETIAADMLVRIPLGQNISMIAGLLGAWPIAVSSYLASKIFAEQVGEFTTLVYRLDGPWNNVQAGFDAPTPAEESSASGIPRAVRSPQTPPPAPTPVPAQP